MAQNKHAGRSCFPTFGVIIAAVMFAGFARNFYLREWLATRPISAMVHIHGLIMTAWVVLFLIQALLIAERRIDLHRKLGIAGGGLAAMVLALGIYTILGSIKRQQPEAGLVLSIELFVAFDGVSLLLFSGLVATALIYRQRPELHKRLMLMGMVSLMPPALGRLVAYFTRENVEMLVLGLMAVTVSVCVAVDAVRHRHVSRVFLYAGALVFLSNILAYFAQIAVP